MWNNKPIEYIDAQIREVESAISVASGRDKVDLKACLRRLEKKRDALM